MSSTASAGGRTEVDLSRAEIRAAYNPFEHGCWLDFANKLTQGYMAEEPDDWVPLAEHHGQWLRHLAGDADVDGDLALLCHRDGLKTTIVTAYLVACLEYKPGFRAIWCMNTRPQAYEKADRELNKVIERNPWLLNLNKPRKTDSKKVKEFHHDASLTTGWLFGAIEGARAHVLIHDDIIKERGDGETSEIINWVDGVAQPMVKDEGRTVMVGTRKRPDDIWSHYRTYEGYALREFPAVLDVWDKSFRSQDDWQERRPDPEYYTEVEDPWSDGETMRVLWPEARGPEWLADKRSKMADHLFWREYTLTIQGASGNLIEQADVDADVDQGGCSIRGREPPRMYRAGAGEAIVVGHDPAQSPTGDDAAFVVQLLRRSGERVLLDAHAEQGMSPSTIKARLQEYDRRYDPALIVIEDNGMQQYVVNDAIEFSPELRAKVTGISTSGKKHSWENGIPRLRNLVENGGIQFYRGHDATEDWIQAALSLELDDGRLSGHTPDLIAAWYMAEQGLRRFEYGKERDAGDDDDDANGVSYL
ncbi:phage terminase large subunit family protein [Halorubrum ezzemoulense]|uniref:Terminase large subunit gp17-like C-terminal domain-containing protein n=1 Tax=Halorubrum ezzemoulense TaxID=337243 RepID=A0A256JVB4_HALEZ|nr:hypothetical protein [Halorubrum ezzemoulense]OYR72721.1 hypothetical protein DJ78_02045 [Halorubrum ezzemoulense]